MRLMIVTAIFQAAAITYSSLPFELTEQFPDWLKVALGWGALSTAIAAAVARVIQQPGLPVETINDAGTHHRNW